MKIIKPYSVAFLLILAIVFVGLFCAVIYFIHYTNGTDNIVANSIMASSTAVVTTTATTTIMNSASNSTSTPTFVVTHISTPSSVKGIYMSSWVAGTRSFRDKLIGLIDSTELNAVVIDVKDSTGIISFSVDDPALVTIGSQSKRIPDIKEFVASLHAKGIYVIGRIATFQDPYFVKIHPEYAVKTKTTGAVWKDRKGISWIDVGAKPVWDYIATIGKEASADGFDELNFDYIRFPSDGNMTDISYPYSEGKVRADVLNDFFTYLDGVFRPLGVPISIDVFGETTVASTDMGIGQMIENALAHFDYVSPMVYPSHFASGFAGWKAPAAHPYEVVLSSMTAGVKRAYTLANATSTVVKTTVATTTGVTTVFTVVPITPPEHVGELRPWLQDFSLGATPYTPLMVREQVQATYASGLNSWLLWNAANKYDAAALLSPDDTFSNSSDFATTTASLNTYAAP